jgi:gas vesicle protein
MSIFDLIEKGKKSREKKARVKTIKNTAIGAAIGVTVGAAAGVLLAPKSGKETREDIAVTARELPEKAKEFVEKAQEKIEEAKAKLQDKKAEMKAEFCATETGKATEDVKL